jgi:CRP-like cAMP-binding protein
MNQPLELLKARIRGAVRIDESELEEIVRSFEIRRFARDEYLLREGGRCGFWGFITEGLVRVYSITDAGEEYTNWFVREDGFIVEFLSFYLREPSLENVVALEDTVLVCVDYSALQQLYAASPAFEKFARMLYEQSFGEMKKRILHRVHFDAETRYRHFMETQPELLQRVPLKYIASYLSVTDSTLSRIRRKILAG